ncbi:NADP-bd_dom domain-containing protein [Fusarium acuminatum]|uniref:NADP-bd_dom domain-containing protein n=1 Tax=Fusarium acuminatum TaxID=5515 RepID=A0ABZ2XBL7_9HYPO
MHFLIIGGTGRNGSLAVKEALARGHTVTALVRNTTNAKIPPHTNLTLVQGTPTSQSDIAKALTTPQPPKVIVTALAQVRVTESPFAALHPDTTPDFMAVSMKALLAAINQANLPSKPKIIVNSAQGAGSSWRSMNLPGKLLFSHGSMGIGLKDHNVVDRLVRESGLPFVLARPVMLAEGGAQVVKVWPEDGKGCAWMPKITRESLGKWLIDAAESSEWDRKSPVLTN